MSAGDLGARVRTRWRVLRAARAGGRDIVWQPAPREAGDARRGQPLLWGHWNLAGHALEIEPGEAPWDVEPPSVPFEMLVQGQGWLDDVMAVGGAEAGAAARGWVLGWLRRHGRGEGRGWDPALTGRRLLRWIDHAPALVAGMDAKASAAFGAALHAQAGYLRASWTEAPAGLPRMEALTGLLWAGMTLAGREACAVEAARGLERAAEDEIGPDGGIASRNPEALLETALLLGWSVDLLAAAGAVPAPLAAAQRRIRGALTALRHGDGGLARFHGGGRGLPGRLARALDGPAHGYDGRVMGFHAVRRGDTTLVVDADRPPSGAASGSAHASTLAFELTGGGAPVIVNCGPGGAFGPDWHRAGRATASHSTLQVDGASSAHVGTPVAHGARRIAPLVDGPARVRAERDDGPDGTVLTLSHDGFGPTHGLVHLRRLHLSADGTALAGEDGLRASGAADRERLAAAGEVVFRVRFHLHPDAVAEVGPGGGVVSIALPGGSAWAFRPGEGAHMTLEPSVHLEPGRRRPRPSLQVVLSGRVTDYGATVGWRLTRSREPAGDGNDE